MDATVSGGRYTGNDAWTYTVHVSAVHDAAGADVAPNATLTALALDDGLAAPDLRDASAPLRLALVKEDGRWVVADAAPGALWGVQRRVLGGALLLVLPSLLGGALVAQTLGRPGPVVSYAQRVESAAPVAGIATALLAGGLLANLAGAPNFLFPQPGDPLPAASFGALAVACLGVLGALTTRSIYPARGSRTAGAAGAAVLLAPAIALGMLASDSIRLAYELPGAPWLLLVVGLFALVAVLPASKLLPAGGRRVVALGFVLAPVLLALALPGARAIALVLVVLAACTMRDHLQAPVHPGYMKEWSASEL